jgi:hypothetical protein
MKLAAPIYTIIFIAGSAATGAAYVASTISVPGFAQTIPEVITTPAPPDPVMFSTLLYRAELTVGPPLIAPLPTRQSMPAVFVRHNIGPKNSGVVGASDQRAFTVASSLWPQRVRTTPPVTAPSSDTVSSRSPAAVQVSLRPIARNGPNSTPTERLVTQDAESHKILPTQRETGMVQDLAYTTAIQEKNAAHTDESSRDKSNKSPFDLLGAMRHFHGVFR